ncbi:MAG: methyltransferase domain-containing protein [Bacteroidetes bacterium]|nr:methyltransferase domain-containing protein [Bacteroidota bacterium]
MKNSREKKYSHFLEFIYSSLRNKNLKDITVLDVGVNTTEHSPVDNYLEKHYPYLHNITALSVTPLEDFSSNYPDVKFVQYDGTIFPFADKAFDFIHSNAVIEHVGDLEDQKLFLHELIRVSNKGVFFTTPNRCFPVEMHTNILFLHYLPKHWFDRILHILNKSWASGDYMNLLSENDLIKIINDIDVDKVEKTNISVIKERLLGFSYQLICMIKC